MLDRAGRLTPGSLRAAIARAVMEAAPDKARKRRETAARFARVERWAEDSGNAALAGRELPPDQVLAADERITAWAGELKATPGWTAGRTSCAPAPTWTCSWAQDSRPGGSPPGAPGAAPAGFASRVTLTVPLATLTRPRGPARRAVRPGPGRPVAGPRPRRRRRAQPEDHMVPDRHRQPGPRHRARLRPARTQEPPQTRRPRPAGVLLHPGQPGRPARERVRHLAAAHPRTRARPDHHPGPGHHRPLRPPAPGQGPRPRGQAPAPVPGPARHLHQPRLPAPRRPVRPRAQHPLRSRRPYLSVQHRPEVPSRPPPQAAPQMESGPAPRRHLPVDHPGRPVLRHRTHALPDLDALSASCGRWRETVFPGWSCTGGRGWIAARA